MEATKRLSLTGHQSQFENPSRATGCWGMCSVRGTRGPRSRGAPNLCQGGRALSSLSPSPPPPIAHQPTPGLESWNHGLEVRQSENLQTRGSSSGLPLPQAPLVPAPPSTTHPGAHPNPAAAAIPGQATQAPRC